MEAYQMSEEERVWLESYDINQFDLLSVASDMAVFSILETKSRAHTGHSRKNYRNNRKRTETSADQKRFFSLSGLLGSAGRFWQAVREHTGNRIS